MQALLHDQIGNGLRIGRGVENRTVCLQTAAQFPGIGEISVVGQGHGAFPVIDDQRLHVFLVIGAGGCIAYMAYHDVAPAQAVQPLGREYIVDKARIAPGGKHAVIIDHDTRAFLPPVLQGKQAVIGKARQIRTLLRKNAKYTTLLMNVVRLALVRTVRHRGPPAFA